MKDDFDEIYDEYKSTLSDLNKLYPAFPRCRINTDKTEYLCLICF